jgi:EAL domain-containing protein (putative c-di-GMP-specific phosphodiesterase class I)
VVQAIVSLAGALGMRVVAEGVEEPWQADILRRLGREYAQGYGLGRPMGAADLEQMLRAAEGGLRSLVA